MMKTRSKQPFVLDYVVNQKEGIENIEKFFDSSDMKAYGYFVDGNKYYYECIHSYLDLEYYHNQDDTDKNKRLKDLSLYLKCNISLECLLNN